ncbi:MAG: ATP-dependent RecD-like DNA helicase [Oscillospiraceae bacterium]|nr:ATP-dependent RecD-like DNA helicase [Oscillospiraceae bacterium]
MEKLKAVVERITYANEDNGFSVIKVKSHGYSDLVTVVGKFAAINAGAVAEFYGEWVVDSKYGRQFSASQYKETMPATLSGLEKYLGSGMIKGIGPVNARRIVKHFREDTLKVIEEQPNRLCEISGIGEKRVEMITTAWKEHMEIKNVMLFLQEHGISTAYAIKIFKTYGDESIDVVKDDPYRLADDIWGIGFRTADRIAQQLGFEKESKKRCMAGVVYVLNEFSGDGHCYAPKGELIERSVKILEIGEDLVAECVAELAAEKKIIEWEDDKMFIPSLYYSEMGLAQRIERIVKTKSAGVLAVAGDNAEVIIERVEREARIKYDSVQTEAVKEALASEFTVITGGPGTGKTTVTKAVIRAFEAVGAKVFLAAPTGRAAKRMTEATRREAKTVHRLLEIKPPNNYKRNSDNPLECDVLIVDEASMLDSVLAYNLLKAVRNEAKVVFVGDVDQLPSVGPGNVLKDIISSGAVCTVELKKIFRQAMGSDIVKNAHRVNRGEFPSLKNHEGTDFFFIEEEDFAGAAGKIIELCKTRLPKYYGIDPVEDIQVLCPMNRGDTGAINLNAELQKALNPSDETISYGNLRFRIGDKVMQIRNNYEKNVFNGDIGRITSIDREDRTVVIKYDGNDIEYDVTELDEVVLAYAITVHKSQGSEYKLVVAPVTTQHFMMLQKNLLYTCITRAKTAMVIVGSKKAVAIAVKNQKAAVRNTMLAEFLRGRD